MHGPFEKKQCMEISVDSGNFNVFFLTMKFYLCYHFHLLHRFNSFETQDIIPNACKLVKF